MKKIIITDSVDSKSVDVLKDAGYEVDYKPGLPKDEIKKIISNYHGLIVRSDTKVTSDLIALMDNMEVIGRAGSGVDNIDSTAATRKGIIVMNTPGGNTISTAEHTMSLMLSMCRNIPQADASIKKGKWDRKSFKGTELYGKTLGVVGLGKIGREVAYRSKAFGMNVIGYDPLLSEEAAAKMNLQMVPLEQIFSDSDIITAHVPLDDKTKNLLSEKTFSLCKKGVKVINCARGGIINEDDLLAALNSGQVSAAALDVYISEPPDFSHQLLSHHKVVTTPHLGASTDEAQEKVAIQIAEQIVDLFKNKKVRGAVNASAVESIANKELAPYVQLAEKLGELHAFFIKGKLLKITIGTFGELLAAANGLLQAALLKGFLSKMLTENVNLINAPFLAKEMGLVVDEIQIGKNPNFSNLISVEFISDVKKKFEGTVFGANDVRVVSIDNFNLEIRPSGNLLFYSNIDKPGVLATVGKILADEKINIAGLSLGRTAQGQEALTVVSVDSEIPENAAKQISFINGVKEVYLVKI